MVMTLLAPAPGKVRFQQLEGALLAAGDMIARLDLDDPAAVQAVTPYTGSFPELGPPQVHSSRSDQRFKSAFQAAKNILQGGFSTHNMWQNFPFFSLPVNHSCKSRTVTHAIKKPYTISILLLPFNHPFTSCHVHRTLWKFLPCWHANHRSTGFIYKVRACLVLGPARPEA